MLWLQMHVYAACYRLARYMLRLGGALVPPMAGTHDIVDMDDECSRCKHYRAAVERGEVKELEED